MSATEISDEQQFLETIFILNKRLSRARNWLEAKQIDCEDINDLGVDMNTADNLCKVARNCRSVESRIPIKLDKKDKSGNDELAFASGHLCMTDATQASKTAKFRLRAQVNNSLGDGAETTSVNEKLGAVLEVLIRRAEAIANIDCDQIKNDYVKQEFCGNQSIVHRAARGMWGALMRAAPEPAFYEKSRSVSASSQPADDIEAKVERTLANGNADVMPQGEPEGEEEEPHSESDDEDGSDSDDEDGSDSDDDKDKPQSDDQDSRQDAIDVFLNYGILNALTK